MSAALHRHDISDEVWSLLERHPPGQRGQWGEIAQDNRRFINAVIASALEQNMRIVIHPRQNGCIQREYDTYLYRLRRLVENVFLHLKRWRALLLVMRRIPHPSSPLSKAGVWLCGQMRWHERMSTRPDYIKDICKRRSPGMVTLAVSNFLHSRTVLVKGRSNRQVGKKIGGTTRFVLCI